jgi:hypothetical protein
MAAGERRCGRERIRERPTGATWHCLPCAGRGGAWRWLVREEVRAAWEETRPSVSDGIWGRAIERA